ncbi:MAG: outer membrane receptor for ferrienterochelin and colicin [Bacteroidetes bacterium]|nr:MAG: outer membrane receptor for ferrienterochelin and colicin [Bacteroidota bacterium]
MKRITSLAIVTLIIIIFSSSFAFAQNGTIRGFVYEKETGEPVIFTNVYLFRTSHGAATDVNGYFTISKIPDGDYTLMVTYLGYDTLREKVSIRGNTVLTRKLFLNKAAFNLEAVQITAEREEARSDTRTSVIKLTPKQISRIPTIGGQADLAQYLQVLPGVIFTGDQGGQLYIRGGSPIQNKVILDGMIVYNPFHSIGLFSVFDTDILRNADIYTGGFNAQHGGRISSVMDLTTRDGNKKRIAGKAGASTFGAKLMVEGPIKKQNESGGGSTSFLLTAKNSYLKESSKLLYNYIDTAGLPFNYTDVYGKVSINGENGSKINFYGFNFRDKVDYDNLASYNWKSSGGGLNFLVIPGNNPVLIEGNFAYSTYKINMEEGSLPSRSSSINGFNMGLGFTYFLGKNEIKYGLEMLGFKTEFDFFNSVGRNINQTENTTEIAGYIKYKMTKGKLLFEPGLRLQYYASLANFSPEPRLAIKYNLTDRIRLKMAAGLYSQNLISANSDRDVVNLFYGFLSGPDNLQEKFNGKDVKHKLQKAEHIIFGVELDPLPSLTMNMEVYYKNFSQLTNINRNKVYNDDTPYNNPVDPNYKPDYLRKDFIIENGNANGFDISFKYEKRKIYFWAVYSLSYVNRSDDSISYVPHYDRRHNVNLVGSYRFGEELMWEFNARWNLGSGFPFTQTAGEYEKLLFELGAGSNYLTSNGQLGVLYGDYNKARLPYYHRLDLSLMRRFRIGEEGMLEINLSVTNIYNRENIFYVNRITGEKVYQLPLMPSFGLSLSF